MRRIRVFVVEDLPAMRELFNELFASSNKFYLEGLATTEAEAKLWLDEHPQGWDLAIIDLILAEGSGFGVIERARQSSPAASIVVFSAFLTPGVVEHCEKLGATVALDKTDGKRLLDWLDEFRIEGP